MAKEEMSEITRSSSNTEPQLLSENGGIQLRDFNPKAVLRFTGRKCTTCDGEILDHWILNGSPEYWCDKTGVCYSRGISDCTFEVEGIRAPSDLSQKKDKTDLSQ